LPSDFSGSFLEARFWITSDCDKPATIKSGQSFQLHSPMIEDRAEKEEAQKIKTGGP
jgi:hypothetical protein